MTFSIGEYQELFLEEADEQLQELNQNLLELEKNPNNSDTINNIFRTAHSLKSSAAFVGLCDLSDLAHKMENLLQGIRDGTMKIRPDIVDVLFKCFDVINSIISSVAAGEEPNQNLKEIMDRIQEVAEGTGDTTYERREVISEKKEELETNLTPDERKLIHKGLRSGRSCSEIAIYINPSAPMKWVKSQLIINNLQQISDIMKTMPSEDELNDEWNNNVFRVILLTDQSVEELRRACELDLISRIDMRKISLIKKNEKMALRFHGNETLVEETEKGEGEDSLDPLGEDKTNIGKEEIIDEEDEKIEQTAKTGDKRVPGIKIVKVSVDKLDMLLNNVGELVISNSGFHKLYEEMKDVQISKTLISEFKNRMDQMSRIAKDLQSGIMKTRMLPIGQIFVRFKRLVRDLSKEFNKLVKLDLKGEDTELDKKVIDAIGEPLMHLMRNAIDHGVESPEERRKLGKSEEATITLSAYQRGNQIIVEVSDDGRGLNIEKIKSKALEKGITTNEILANMDNDDIYDFIFSPGFSTSDVVTDISGRGVGMNVVREIVNELSGNVRIETEVGMGTKFILTFPLTLAITPAIMVTVKDEVYAIPLPDVVETIKIFYSDITTIEGYEVINLRGEILSLIRLSDFVGIERDLDTDKRISVVVVGYGNRKIGVIVDSLEGKQEIVIKSIEENYTYIEGLSGVSILGDGSICLILDVQSMISNVISNEERLSKQRVIEKEDFEVEQVLEIPKVEGDGDLDKGLVGSEKIEDERVMLFDSQTIGEEKTGSDQRDIGIVEEQESDPEEKTEDALSEKERMPTIREEGELEIHKSQVIEDGDGALDDSIVIEVEDEDIQKRVQEALIDFKEELQTNIERTLDDDRLNEDIMNSLQIDKRDIQKIQIVANIGITNAAESLSSILNKKIALSIPEVKIIPLNNMPSIIGEIDSVYIGVYFILVGDIKGAILFLLSEDIGFELIDMLYGTESGKTKELDEDGGSALKELTNIVGCSILNVLSDKTGLAIRPSVPSVVHDFIQSTMNSILVENKISGDYSLLMDTEFYFDDDDSVLGKMLVFMDTEALKKIIEDMR
ncbi:MAG: chemotaxis protein CheW [Spirochaetota bacterium]|nr:chemotaxis protein CheW [Spirochaetota bacterium]